MLNRLKNWLSRRAPEESTPPPVIVRTNGRQTAPARRPAQATAARPEPGHVDAGDKRPRKIETVGPGKNVLIRKRFLREDTGTHETLSILDDSMVDTGEETGIDPYNTGGFDRSRNWDKRFGK